ncbi:MAG: YbeD family protein [Desulfonatronovibrionaceae bacterium]
MGDAGKLEFPRVWEYKVIALAEDGVREDIVSILNKRGIRARVEEGRLSREGSYRSFHFSVYVQNRRQMRDLGNDLACCKKVKMVL